MQEGDRLCRKAAAGAELVSAGAGRWSLQEGGRFRHQQLPVLHQQLVQNWQLLVPEGGCCCRKVVAGARLVAASAGKWSPLQEW